MIYPVSINLVIIALMKSDLKFKSFVIFEVATLHEAPEAKVG